MLSHQCHEAPPALKRNVALNCSIELATASSPASQVDGGIDDLGPNRHCEEHAAVDKGLSECVPRNAVGQTLDTNSCALLADRRRACCADLTVCTCVHILG